MQAMQALVRLPEVAHTMQELSKEMMKAGIIEELLDETMSSVEDEEEMEEAAQSEVDKVNIFLLLLNCGMTHSHTWYVCEGDLTKIPDGQGHQ